MECVTSSHELRSTFFEFVNGFFWVQTDNEAIGRTKHFNSRPDQCNRIIGARRLYGISCSAALICEFCATRRIRFFVSDLLQKRPSWRGAAVAGPFCLQKKPTSPDWSGRVYWCMLDVFACKNLHVNFLFIHRESVQPEPLPSCLDRMNMRSLHLMISNSFNAREKMKRREKEPTRGAAALCWKLGWAASAAPEL